MPEAHFINGEWYPGLGESFRSFDPAKNEIIYEANQASSTQVDQAVNAAREAFFNWSLLTKQARLEFIYKFSDQLTEKKDEFAFLIAAETGKPYWEAKTEVAAMLGKVKISETAFDERTGTKELTMPVGKAVLRHRPHGVVAVFGPYNFPGHLPNGHIIPALLAGNTVIFKPSELTPKVADFYIRLWQAAGLPRGVINLVQGKVNTGKSLAIHNQIDGLFFTGSSTTGKLLHQQFAGRPGKILALEMGGNNPLIVGKIGDNTAATHDIIQSAFITSGQRCTCARKLFVPANSQGDELIKKLVYAAENIKVGLYDDPDQPFMGSMISQEAAEKMIDIQQALIGKGANPLLTMRHLQNNTGLITPGIIDVSGLTDLPDEEHFGPLLKVHRYQSLEQAIHEANNTQFGLSAGLLSDSQEEYDFFLPRIRAGIVNWNRPITGASSAAPFGGIGDSGNHRASAYYAADYCAYPVASVELERMTLPASLSPGLTL